MSKTPVVIYLDSALIAQIKAVLPDSGSNSIEEAVASLVGDGITGDHACWTDSISWMPGEAEEETSIKPSIACIPRDLAKLLNPIISTCQEETLLNGGALAAFLADVMGANASEGAIGFDHAYLFGWAIKAALEYESGV